MLTSKTNATLEDLPFTASHAVGVLEEVWSGIQTHHPDLPRVVMVLASGTEMTVAKRWGHWAAGRWRVDAGNDVGEILIAGERLFMGGAWVLETLLHEAAHALAFARDIKDHSRQGRYHNKRYKELAIELGLDVETDHHTGWSLTCLAQGTKEKYTSQVALLNSLCKHGYRQMPPQPKASQLADLISALGPTKPPPAFDVVSGMKGPSSWLEDGFKDWKPPEQDPLTPTPRRGRLTLSCQCFVARLIRVVPSVAELGTISCGACGSDFVERN